MDMEQSIIWARIETGNSVTYVMQQCKEEFELHMYDWDRINDKEIVVSVNTIVANAIKRWFEEYGKAYIVPVDVLTETTIRVMKQVWMRALLEEPVNDYIRDTFDQLGLDEIPQTEEELLKDFHTYIGTIYGMDKGGE